MARILVIDDERHICELLRAVLTRHGHEVLTAMSGHEGLALFLEHRPRVTLLDLRMPGMDGLDVLKQIRDIDERADIMVLSGRMTDELEFDVLGLGVTGVLRKGRSLNELVSELNRTLAKPVPAQPSAVRDSSGKWQEEESILIVDDEPLICSLLTTFLTGHGYQTRAVQSGAEALAAVDQEPPQMIVLDMYMPGMHGVKVLQALRARNYQGGTIILTASQDEVMLKEAMELGTVDVMSKPVDLQRLLLTIQVGLVLSVG